MSVKLPKVEKGNQTLYPFIYDNLIYYVRFVRRGSRLDCSAVYKLGVKGERQEPVFVYQNKNKRLIQRVIKAAKEEF